MQQLIYSSRSTRPLAGAELASLLQNAQQDNELRQVTGLLLYGGGMFVQVLEGEPAAIQELWDKLLRDSRHTDLLPLAKKPVTKRSFEGWAMAFEGPPNQDLAAVPGQLPTKELDRRLTSLAPADALLLRSLRRQLFTPTA